MKTKNTQNYYISKTRFLVNRITTLNAEPYIIDQWRKVEIRTYLHRIFFNIFSVLSHSIQNENIDIELSCNLHLTNKKPIIPIDPRVY